MTPAEYRAHLDTLTDEQVKENFPDLLAQALAIEESEQEQDESQNEEVA